MKRFRFPDVAAGATLNKLSKDTELQVKAVHVDDKSVAIDKAQTAYSDALDRAEHAVELGPSQPKGPPTLDQFPSKAEFTKALDRWERKQVWALHRKGAAQQLSKAGKFAGRGLQKTGLTGAAKGLGAQLFNLTAIAADTAAGRKVGFAKDVVLELAMAAHPHRVEQRHQVTVTMSDDSTQSFQVAVVDPAATLALHRSTLPAVAIATCPWFPFSGIVTCGVVAYRFSKLAKQAETEGDLPLARALERTGRRMRGLSIAALGWVFTEPLYAAGTMAETMQRQAMKGVSVATVESFQGPIVDVGVRAEPGTWRQRLQDNLSSFKVALEDAKGRVKAKRDGEVVHPFAAALAAAQEAQQASSAALAHLNVADDLEAKHLDDAAHAVRDVAGEEREDAVQALGKTSKELRRLTSAMSDFHGALPQPPQDDGKS